MLAGSAQLLASALLHASWNASLKRERDPQLAVLGILASALLVATLAALLVPGGGLPRPGGLAWTAGAGVFEGLYFVTLAGALARASYGAVYAIARGGAMVLVWPAGVMALGERATAQGAAGAAVIGAGVLLVALAGRQHATRGGMLLAGSCAASIAGYHVCYDRALHAGSGHAPVFAVALAVALPLVWLVARLHGGGGSIDRRALLRWLAAGVVATASFLLFLHGLDASGAGPALTLRNTSVVFAQAIAAAFGEPLPRRQVLGALLVAAGAALLTLS